MFSTHLDLFIVGSVIVDYLPLSLIRSDAEVTKGLLVEQGVSHLRDGQQRTPGVRFGICGTVGPIPAVAADDPT